MIVFDTDFVPMLECPFAARVILLSPVLLALASTVAAQPRGAQPSINWVRVPAGTFQMGCVPTDERCGSDESPRHAVSITRAFGLMATEVTVEMFTSGGGDLEEQPVWSRSPKHPVVSVVWMQADAFCAKAGGRLPTEAEWEYAARGGRDGAIFSWGDQAPLDKPGASNGAAVESDSPRPVGSFPANGFGLFDMVGNVWEWTADWASIYDAEPAKDPTGLSSGRVKIVRGGSYGDDPSNLRVSNRTPNQPTSRNINVGFRCARDAR